MACPTPLAIKSLCRDESINALVACWLKELLKVSNSWGAIMLLVGFLDG